MNLTASMLYEEMVTYLRSCRWITNGSFQPWRAPDGGGPWLNIYDAYYAAIAKE